MRLNSLKKSETDQRFNCLRFLRHNGGVNGMKNNFKLKDIRKEVYGEDYKYFDTIKTRAVHQVVKVDYFVHGCPVYIPEFLKVMKAVLAGLPYQVPDYSVCVECKLNENVCMYDRGLTCLGPITPSRL